jgi:hypothetical protein
VSRERLVRPYLLTGGRTRVEGVDVPLEAMLRCTEVGRSAIDRRSPEEARLLIACGEPTALVEVAATLDLPIGVVRVLAGDLLREGYLEKGEVASGDDVPLLERLLDGLKDEA